MTFEWGHLFSSIVVAFEVPFQVIKLHFPFTESLCGSRLSTTMDPNDLTLLFSFSTSHPSHLPHFSSLPTSSFAPNNHPLHLFNSGLHPSFGCPRFLWGIVMICSCGVKSGCNVKPGREGWPNVQRSTYCVSARPMGSIRACKGYFLNPWLAFWTGSSLILSQSAT